MRLGASDHSLSPTVEILYSNHRGWLEGWLRRKLGDAFVAADLAQDTFVSVIAAGTAGQIREPRPFLATIARRLMAHHHRRRLLEESYLEALAALPEGMAPSPEAHCLALEALREMDRALDGLPPRVKEAFLLAHLEELSYADIAARLDVSTSSVKQYLTRAHRHCLFALSA
ncbi:sigma-70 family RNA polymerase sigma factor [Pseudorhodoferax sp.]|uniref:sigma-70 family RNA polymerase sigma factor n=1 Tax=Pseudorhodoferax sp. TaxID=1993553 RepID=UPI0039E55DF4